MTPLLTVKIHRNADDDGIVAQLMTVPQVGETISLPNDDGVEHDVTVTSINHWLKIVDGQYRQVEIVIFCQENTITIL